jgi:hypothetical protein
LHTSARTQPKRTSRRACRRRASTDSSRGPTWDWPSAEFKQARDLLLQKMNTSRGDALVQVQADKARLETALREQGEDEGGRDAEVLALSPEDCCGGLSRVLLATYRESD